jgi:hypothetical protein
VTVIFKIDRSVIKEQLNHQNITIKLQVAMAVGAIVGIGFPMDRQSIVAQNKMHGAMSCNARGHVM